MQTESTHSADGGVEGGGPIMRNKLFFFGAYDPSRTVLTLQAPAGFPLQSLGNVDQVRKSKTYSTKLTWQINPTNRIDASFFGDPSTGEMGPQRLVRVARHGHVLIQLAAVRRTQPDRELSRRPEQPSGSPRPRTRIP